jgi:hypothetical protein
MFLAEKVRRCKSVRQLTIVIKFTQTINKESEADLSVFIAKYKDMPKDSVSAYILRAIRRKGFELFTFTEYCEMISCLWVHHALDNGRAKVFVISRPGRMVKG